MRRSGAGLDNLAFKAFQCANALQRLDIAEHLLCALVGLLPLLGTQDPA